MVGIIFIAMFLGSLSAVTLVFSGWPVWVAIAAYLGCGMLGLVLIVAIDLFRPSITKGAKMLAAYVARIDTWRQHEQANLQPRPISALSETYSKGNSK